MKTAIQGIVVVLCMLLLLSSAGCKSSKKAQRKKAEAKTKTEMVPNETATLSGYTRSQIYFKLQIGAFTTPLSENDILFHQVAGEEVKIDISPSGLYRYSVGKFSHYDQAVNAEKELKSRGYKDTFIVAYGDDDKRIELHMSEIWNFLYEKQ